MKKNQKNGEWTYTDKEENEIKQTKRDKYYSIIIQSKHNVFFIEKDFYLNGVLAQKGSRYKGYGFLKGIWTDHDEYGNITKQIDYDAPYKAFPWEKIKAWLENRKIDLLDPFTEVSRNNENNQPIWYLNWDTKKLDKYGNQIIQDVELDGKTGKVLKDSTHTFGE